MKSLLKEAFQKRKNQNCEEAAGIYEQVWNQNPEFFNEWDGWSYAFCLSKLNQHQKALEVCQAVYSHIPNSEILMITTGQFSYLMSSKNTVFG